MRTGRGSGGCLSALGYVLVWPIYIIFVGVVKLYQFAWNKPASRQRKILSVSGVSAGLLALIIIGAAAAPSSTPSQQTGATTPTPAATQAVPVATQTTSPTPSPATTTAAPTRTVTTTRAAPTHRAPTTQAAPTHTVATTQAPPPPPTSATGCYPKTSSGNCYRAGEFCPARDHYATGVAGNGESIVCEDDNGWRWVAR